MKASASVSLLKSTLSSVEARISFLFELTLLRFLFLPLNLFRLGLFFFLALVLIQLLSQDLEMECLKPQSSQLPDIALSILKLVSHHKGLK